MRSIRQIHAVCPDGKGYVFLCRGDESPESNFPRRINREIREGRTVLAESPGGAEIIGEERSVLFIFPVQRDCDQGQATAVGERIISDGCYGGRYGYGNQGRAASECRVVDLSYGMGMVTEAKDVHPLNAMDLIDVAEEGMVIAFKDVQPQNILSPIEVR